MDPLTGTSKGPGLHRLSRTTPALLLKLLNSAARLFIDHRLHVRRHVLLNRFADKLPCGGKLERLPRLLRDLLSGLNVASKNPSRFWKTCNP